MTFTYSGPEAIEMLKNHFPKTWENEINDGRLFIKSLMRMYNLDNVQAYQKYLRVCGSCEKAISALAALHLMNEQVRIGREIKVIQDEQQLYVHQSIALEGSKVTSFRDKMMLRQHYSEKKNQLQNRLDQLINEIPVFGAETVKVQLTIFDN